MEEVAVYFKDLEEAVERDPGDQASKVIEFRKSVKENREILFDTFGSTDEWERLLYDHLAAYLTKHYADRESQQTKQAPRRSPEREEETELVRADASLEAVLQTLGDETNDPSNLETARAHLYTQSLVNGHVYRTAALNAEELAFLYGARQQIELTPREAWSVYQTLMADDEKVKPGWYWLNLNTEQLNDILTQTATQSPLYAARSHARDLLRSADEAAYRQLIHEVVDGDNVKESDLALGPFVENPREEDQEFLHTLVNEHQGDIAETAWRGIFKFKAETDANEAIEWIVDTPKEQRGRYSPLLENILEDADTEHLRTLLTVETGKNRAKVVDALGGELAEGELRELAQDDNLDVAAVALMELAKRGIDVSDRFINERLLPQQTEPSTETGGFFRLLSHPTGPSIYSRREVLRALYRTWNRDELEEKVRWSTNGALRYQVLFDLYHETQGDRLRDDIRNEFQNMPGRALQGVVGGNDDDRDDSFTVGSFYRASFQVLVDNTRPDDVEIARDFLREPHDSTFTRKIIKDALKIIAQHGGPDDVDLVWGYVTHDNIGVRRQATALVLNLDPERFQEHASALLNLDDWAIKEIVFRFALENDEELPTEAVRQLLYSSESQTRRGALAYLVETMEEAKRRELLNSYPQAEDIDFDFYYYDVVGWLDRLLFAPEPIREYYREELADTLGEENSLVFAD
jgi:hypothetical protein